MTQSERNIAKLHVLDTPIVSCLLVEPTLVLFLKELLLETVRAVDTIPPVSRFDAKAVRGRWWASVLGPPRAL